MTYVTLERMSMWLELQNERLLEDVARDIYKDGNALNMYDTQI